MNETQKVSAQQINAFCGRSEVWREGLLDAKNSSYLSLRNPKMASCSRPLAERRVACVQAFPITRVLSAVQTSMLRHTASTRLWPPSVRQTSSSRPQQSFFPSDPTLQL